MSAYTSEDARRDLATVKRGAYLAEGLSGCSDRLAAYISTIERERDEARSEAFAAYVGARDFDDGCLCDECCTAITRRLTNAEQLLATLDASRPEYERAMREGTE